MRFRKTTPYEMQKLGAYLKQLRTDVGLSIHQAARKAGIAPSHLLKIEAGDTFSNIGVKTLVKLSKLYNIPIASILKEATFIESDGTDLPDLPQYLRLKYNLSPQAIRDMEMAKEIVDKKYSTLGK